MERLSKLAISHSSYDMSEHRVAARSDCSIICPLIMLHFSQISWKEVETTPEQIYPFLKVKGIMTKAKEAIVLREVAYIFPLYIYLPLEFGFY